jgi:signal transduction histidine kinase
VLLEVLDDGVGIPHGEGPAGTGLGLSSMRQRAEEVGGSLEVASSGRGTTVRAVLPPAVGGDR